MTGKVCLALLLVFALSACSYVKNQVQVFHKLDPAFEPGTTVAIVAGDEKKEGSLEFETHAKKLGIHLTALGLDVVDLADNPDYAVLFNYNITDGKPITRNYSIPVWGETGIASSTTSGTISSYGGTSHYSGTTTYAPSYGVTGYQTVSKTEVIYGRALVIDMFKYRGVPSTEDLPAVLELTVSSAGTCSSITAVIDEMLKAAFTDFPPESGSDRRVDVPSDSDC